jgi:Domain of unknown function (DUF5659)
MSKTTYSTSDIYLTAYIILMTGVYPESDVAPNNKTFLFTFPKAEVQKAVEDYNSDVPANIRAFTSTLKNLRTEMSLQRVKAGSREVVNE